MIKKSRKIKVKKGSKKRRNSKLKFSRKRIYKQKGGMDPPSGGGCGGGGCDDLVNVVGSEPWIRNAIERKRSTEDILYDLVLEDKSFKKLCKTKPFSYVDPGVSKSIKRYEVLSGLKISKDLELWTTIKNRLEQYLKTTEKDVDNIELRYHGRNFSREDGSEEITHCFYSHTYMEILCNIFEIEIDAAIDILPPPAGRINTPKEKMFMYIAYGDFFKGREYNEELFQMYTSHDNFAEFYELFNTYLEIIDVSK